MGLDVDKQLSMCAVVDRYESIEQPEGRGQHDKKCHKRPGVGGSTRELRRAVIALWVSWRLFPPVLSDSASWDFLIDLELQFVGHGPPIPGWVFIDHAADQLAKFH